MRRTFVDAKFKSVEACTVFILVLVMTEWLGKVLTPLEPFLPFATLH